MFLYMQVHKAACVCIPFGMRNLTRPRPCRLCHFRQLSNNMLTRIPSGLFHSIPALTTPSLSTLATVYAFVLLSEATKECSLSQHIYIGIFNINFAPFSSPILPLLSYSQAYYILFPDSIPICFTISEIWLLILLPGQKKPVSRSSLYRESCHFGKMQINLKD